MKKIILKFLFAIFGYILLPIFSAYILYFFHYTQFNLLHNHVYNNYILYDRNNELIKKINQYVLFNELPKNLINAFIATEDTQFFNHCGISISSIIRSLAQNIKDMKFTQGGSTITQQLIKVYKGNFEKTILRKMTDIFLALLIETIYSKESIFEAYCNILYFGKNIVGVAQCAKILFNKDYKDLELDECAIIAGIIQRPEYYNPLKNYEASIRRRNIVLKRMLTENFITKKEYNTYLKKKTEIFTHAYSDFNNTIHKYISIRMSDLSLAHNHSYSIHTTINQDIQKKLYMIVEKYKNEKLKHINHLILSALVIDLTDGSIVSIIDTTNTIYKKHSPLYQYKQIGSLIKPLIFYFAAIKGNSLNAMYNDSPIDPIIFNGWKPQNHYKKYLGEIMGSTALEKSNNTIPIKLLQQNNINLFIDFIQPYFKEKIKPFYSIALGCLNATPFEIGNIYYHFFSSMKNQYNNLVNNQIFSIKKIIKNSGGIIYKNKNELIPNKFKYETTIEIANILKKIGKKFTNKFTPNSKKTIYSKTGTTNHASCCWCICSDLNYLVVCFLSSKNNEKLYEKYNITSAKTTIPIAIQLLNEI